MGLNFKGIVMIAIAKINFTKKSFKIINVCDEKDFYTIEKLTYEKNNNQLKVKTYETEFLFIKIDDAPIYELKIIGTEINIQNKRISKFYTIKSALNRFEQHDCGDFQG